MQFFEDDNNVVDTMRYETHFNNNTVTKMTETRR